MAQNIVIKYGSFTIGSSSNTIREGTFRQTHSYRRYTMDVDFVTTHTTDAGFNTNLLAIENVLDADNQQLLIKFGSETYRDFNPTNFTGLNVRTSITKSGSDFDTDRSRLYSFSVTIDLPADSSDDTYRREASWSLSFTPSRQMVLNFSGTYTAGYPSSTATKATKNYVDNVATWISAVFTDLDAIFSTFSITEADFEVTSESITSEDDDHHIARFSKTYTQVLFPDKTWASGTPNNDAGIIDANVSFVLNVTNSHGNKQVAPQRVNVEYSCSVDYTDTPYTSMKALWTDDIKPWLVTQAQTRWGGSFAAIESERTTLNVSQGEIRSSLTILVSAGTASVLREDRTESRNVDQRKTYSDIWDGEPNTFSVFSPGLSITSSVSVTTVRIGAAVRNIPAPPLALAGGTKGGWDITGLTSNNSAEWVGVDVNGKGNSKEISTITFNTSYKWVSSAINIAVPNGARKTVLKKVKNQAIREP